VRKRYIYLYLLVQESYEHPLSPTKGHVGALCWFLVFFLLLNLVLVRFVLLNLVLRITVYPFVLLLLPIALSVLRLTAPDYLCGIFNPCMKQNTTIYRYSRLLTYSSRKLYRKEVLIRYKKKTKNLVSYIHIVKLSEKKCQNRNGCGKGTFIYIYWSKNHTNILYLQPKVMLVLCADTYVFSLVNTYVGHV
jgi:hypothetical protein